MAAFPLFVSLTTMRSRLVNLPTVLRRLLEQSMRPERIILNISPDPWYLDEGISLTDLPTAVRRMARDGLIEIYNVPNLGSYRKLLPTLRRFQGQDILVATADDDVIYPHGWLEGLRAAYEKHGCVVAYRCRSMTFRDELLLPYNQWPFAQVGEAVDPSPFIVPTGRGGVLYHSSFFPNLSLLREFRTLAPLQDDVAFRLATMLQGVPACPVDFSASGTEKSEFDGFHYNANLYSRNVTRFNVWNDNDYALRRIVNFCLARELATDQMARLAKSAIPMTGCPAAQ
jgi:hypothetical protein